jgi:hypothetical protein
MHAGIKLFNLLIVSNMATSLSAIDKVTQVFLKKKIIDIVNTPTCKISVLKKMSTI